MPALYFDFNASTPVAPELIDAMRPFWSEHFGNPSSGHAHGRAAKHALEQARAQVAAAINAKANEVIFTGSGTEATNLALVGSFERSTRRHAVTSVIEHPATLAPLEWLARQGLTTTRVGVDGDGVLRLNEVREAISSRTWLVTLMHANNETGVMQPIAEVAQSAKSHGALLHCDASQSLGKVSVDVNALGVDLLTIAGHKLYAPKGIGALYVREGTALAPFMRGAGHERGLRPGTENVAFAVGLGLACTRATDSLTAESRRLTTLRDAMEQQLRLAVPGLERNGHATLRLPNTLSVRFPNVSGTELLAKTPSVSASTGSACHDGHETASAVILAMGVAPESAAGTVRLSLGRGTTMADVEAAVRALATSWRALQLQARS